MAIGVISELPIIANADNNHRQLVHPKEFEKYPIKPCVNAAPKEAVPFMIPATVAIDSLFPDSFLFFPMSAVIAVQIRLHGPPTRSPAAKITTQISVWFISGRLKTNIGTTLKKA